MFKSKTLNCKAIKSLLSICLLIMVLSTQTLINTNQIESIELNTIQILPNSYYAIIRFTSGKVLGVNKADYDKIIVAMIQRGA